MERKRKKKKRGGRGREEGKERKKEIKEKKDSLSVDPGRKPLPENISQAHLELGPEFPRLPVRIVLLDQVQLCLEPVPREEGGPVILPLIHLHSKGRGLQLAGTARPGTNSAWSQMQSIPHTHPGRAQEPATEGRRHVSKYSWCGEPGAR